MIFFLISKCNFFNDKYMKDLDGRANPMSRINNHIKIARDHSIQYCKFQNKIIDTNDKKVITIFSVA